MNSDQDPIDAKLDAFFAADRSEPASPKPELLARLATDMENALQKQPAPQPSGQSLFERFKGFFAASGLAGATALGIWIGFTMPETLTGIARGFGDTDAVGIEVFLPSADLVTLGEEG